MWYIHLSVGKPFLAVTHAFLPPTYQTAPCCCWGRHVQFLGARRLATWNSRHLETSSYTIVSREGLSCQSSKGQTTRFRINPNKQHLSFSSFFTTRNVLLAKHQHAGVSTIITSPLLYLLSPYLHCSSSTSIATRMNFEWWLCSKQMSLDHGSKRQWPNMFVG
jgi:hypothetical protein